MSFHGALLGIIIITYIFSIKRNLKHFFIRCNSMCRTCRNFFGRIKFINAELVVKLVVFRGLLYFLIDMSPRHPSQIYEAILEGLVLFIILNVIINKKNYLTGTCLPFSNLIRNFQNIFRNFQRTRSTNRLLLKFYKFRNDLKFFYDFVWIYYVLLHKEK